MKRTFVRDTTGKKAFTLVELMLVTTVLAIVASLVIVNFKNAGRQADEQLIFSELATIREASLRFKQDMGQPPQFIAELLQSPDPADPSGPGGWWWRSDGNYPVPNSNLPALPDPALYTYDPVIRRGWNGPYLQREIMSDNTLELREIRENPAGASLPRGTIDSDNLQNPARKMALLKSDYSNFPQATMTQPDRMVSHYQFIFNDPSGEMGVQFLDDPTVLTPRIIAKINLGIKP